MIDLHSHILPGIDDGASHMEASIALGEEAVNDGIDILYATPHHKNGVYDNEKEDVCKAVQQLQQVLDERQLPLEVRPGQEVHMYGDIVQDLKQQQLLTFDPQHQYILLELPHDRVPQSAHRILYEIQMQGVIPIIPHPERNAQIRRHPNLLYELIERGALSQLTAGSLVGKFGESIQQTAEQLIQHQMCHIIASDAHRAGTRGFNMREAYEMIEDQFGPELRDQLQHNARLIAAGDDVHIDPPVKVESKRKKKWWPFTIGSRSKSR